jgi:hypothetical protein
MHNILFYNLFFTIMDVDTALLGLSLQLDTLQGVPAGSLGADV